MKWEPTKKSARDLSQMSTLLLFPPELRQRPNANASATDAVSRRPPSDTPGMGVGTRFSRGSGGGAGRGDKAISPTDCKELMAAEWITRGVSCGRVCVGVHVHALSVLKSSVRPHARGLSKSLRG